MRSLPKNLNQKQKIILIATKDYFGEGAPTCDLRRATTNVSLWLMQKRKGIDLNDEEKGAVWCIAQNLSDKTYSDTLNLKFNNNFT
ncbi:MAG: hypothetical protein WC711_00135 [Candidatus Staskawiczbacteria bacterium]|jgi:hypothetical protein